MALRFTQESNTSQETFSATDELLGIDIEEPLCTDSFKLMGFPTSFEREVEWHGE